jgi:hypothetical protein
MSFAAGGMILIQKRRPLQIQGGKIMDMKDMIEELEDIKNIGQMLEISLQTKEDNHNIIRSVSIINRKLAAVIDKATAEKDKKPGGN